MGFLHGLWDVDSGTSWDHSRTGWACLHAVGPFPVFSMGHPRIVPRTIPVLVMLSSQDSNGLPGMGCGSTIPRCPNLDLAIGRLMDL